MRVGLVAEWLDAWRGGAEASTSQFLYALVAEGMEVHLFTRSRPAAIPGMFVHTLGGAAMSRTRRSMTFAHRVERLVRSGDFDVVHAISPCRCADLYQPRGGTVAETVERNLALIGSPLFRTVKRQANRLNLKQRYLLSLERRLFRDPQGPVVAALSRYVVDQLQRHYHLPDDRIRLVFNGVDPDATPATQRAVNRAAVRREFGVTDDELLVLLVAHNFKLKGVHRWLEALARIIRTGEGTVRSLIVGKGDSPSWHRLADRLGVSQYVTFTGPSDRVTVFRHASDVLVHPTYYDPCSRVVLEALGSGLPCVATRWDGASEMIRHGENGFVIDDPGDVAALADAVGRLRDPGLRQRFARGGQVLAQQVSMARHAREMIAVYDELRRGARASMGQDVRPRPIVAAS